MSVKFTSQRHELASAAVFVKRLQFEHLPCDLQDLIRERGFTTFNGDVKLIQAAQMQPDEVGITLENLAVGLFTLATGCASRTAKVSAYLAAFRTLMFECHDVRFYPPINREM